MTQGRQNRKEGGRNNGNQTTVATWLGGSYSLGCCYMAGRRRVTSEGSAFARRSRGRGGTWLTRDINIRLTYSFGNSPNANEQSSDVLPHAPTYKRGSKTNRSAMGTSGITRCKALTITHNNQLPTNLHDPTETHISERPG